MIVHYAPRVLVIARPQVDWPALTAAIGAPWRTDARTDAEALCEAAGRECYESFVAPRPGGNATYLRHILESGHGSILEHAVWSLHLSGVSRACVTELLRHRAGLSPSMRSQRYCDEGVAAQVVAPPLRLAEIRGADAPAEPGRAADGRPPGVPAGDAADLAHAAATGRRWLDAQAAAFAAYRDEVAALTHKLTRDAYHRVCIKYAAAGLGCSDRDAWERERDRADRTADRKAARGAARSLLPEATATRLVLSGNARAWRNVIEQRAASGADAEIRRLAVAVHAALLPEAPALFGDYTAEGLPDGSTALATPYRKV